MFQNPGMFKGVMQKVNPFRSTSQVGTAWPSLCRRVGSINVGPLLFTQVSKSQSSESLEQGGDSISNPTQVGERPSLRYQTLSVQFSLTFMGAHITVTFQNPGMLKGVMQKVNPFKSTSQVPVLIEVTL